MRRHDFKKLKVWQLSKDLTVEIYKLTYNFPQVEKFGLTSQIRWATLSISANIAEGMSRITEKDKARFINQAFSSAIEVVNFLILANDLEFLSTEDYLNLREKIEKITNQLNSLYKKFDK